MKALIRRHPLVAFFVLAYLGSWLVWSPWWLAQNGLRVLPYRLSTAAPAGINQLGLFAGPFTAAFVVTGIVSGRAGVRALLRRCLQWRVRPIWYVVVLIVIPVLAGSFYLVGAKPSPALSGAGIATLMAMYALYLLGGPIQEEPGWRGFALPRLQELPWLQGRYGVVGAALLLGVLHCCWHLPLFFTDEWDTPRNSPADLLAYLIFVVAMSVVMSWITNGSRGSVLIAILGHNGINWSQLVITTGVGVTIGSSWPAALGMSILALFAILITRGRLGLADTQPEHVTDTRPNEPVA